MSKDQYIPLRKVGGSIYLRIPAQFIRDHDLKVGDIVVWKSDGVFRIVKRTQFEELVNQAEELAAVG